MAITSVGYDGTVLESGWAKLINEAGSRYGVAGALDLKVTTLSGQDRSVAIAAGTAHGSGILDTLSSAENVGPMPSVGSGSRWDTIVLRRNWATNTTTPMYLQGTSAQAIASGRASDPGVQDDQPLALVQITAGQTLPTSIVDLRCWGGNGGLVAASADALAYLDTPGSVVWVGTTQYRREVAGDGTTSWRSSDLAGAVWSYTASAPASTETSTTPTIARQSGGFARSGSHGVSIPKTAVYDLRLDMQVISGISANRLFADVVVTGASNASLRISGYGENQLAGCIPAMELTAGDSIRVDVFHSNSVTRTVSGTVKVVERTKPAW